MKTIRVRDLRDEVFTTGPHAFLRCFVCGNECSAHAGDYFMARGDAEFTCCDEPMHRVTSTITYRRA